MSEEKMIECENCGKMFPESEMIYTMEGDAWCEECCDSFWKIHSCSICGANFDHNGEVLEWYAIVKKSGTLDDPDWDDDEFEACSLECLAKWILQKSKEAAE